MHNISNTNRSLGSSSSSGENIDITTSFTGTNYYKELKESANTVPLDRIFKHYGLNLNKYNNKILCPFKSHKGGRETTASFKYYADTNTYHCFGCRQGNSACDFVSEMDHISKTKAAEKILSLFGEEVTDEVILNRQDLSEKLNIMMNFSNLIRDFRQTYIDEKSQAFIENICETYDDINIVHDVDNDALVAMIEKFQRKIDLYISCLK
jgi:hypothetical protein